MDGRLIIDQTYLNTGHLMPIVVVGAVLAVWNAGDCPILYLIKALLNPASFRYAKGGIDYVDFSS
jgi:hypothetical protein